MEGADRTSRRSAPRIRERCAFSCNAEGQAAFEYLPQGRGTESRDRTVNSRVASIRHLNLVAIG